MLNVASGAMATAATIQAIADAQAWMTANLPAGGKLPYGIAAGSAAGGAATQLSDALDQFNNGGVVVPHCMDGPGSGGMVPAAGSCPDGGSSGGAGGGGGGGGSDAGSNGGKPPPIGSSGPDAGAGGGGPGIL
jgi:hypothetical protein